MGKKGAESISACQVDMDPGPVCIICELYLDNTEKVLLGPSDTKPNLLNITPHEINQFKFMLYSFLQV